MDDEKLVWRVLGSKHNEVFVEFFHQKYIRHCFEVDNKDDAIWFSREKDQFTDEPLPFRRVVWHTYFIRFEKVSGIEWSIVNGSVQITKKEEVLALLDDLDGVEVLELNYLGRIVQEFEL